MTLNEIIKKFKQLQENGHGNLKVKYDFGACEVEKITIEKDINNENYVHLDWCK